MSRNSPKMLSRRPSLLAAATVALAGPAMAGDNQTPQPLTPGACIATGIKPPVSFNGSGGILKLPGSPKVQFDFWIGNDDTRCPAETRRSGRSLPKARAARNVGPQEASLSAWRLVSA
jgi:hypothetical protein